LWCPHRNIRGTRLQRQGKDHVVVSDTQRLGAELLD
jgi:hypothetical protein